MQQPPTQQQHRTQQPQLRMRPQQIQPEERNDKLSRPQPRQQPRQQQQQQQGQDRGQG